MYKTDGFPRFGGVGRRERERGERRHFSVSEVKETAFNFKQLTVKKADI